MAHRAPASGRRFALAVLGLGMLAAGVRVWFAVAVVPDLPLPGDAALYRELAENLADGRGLSLPGLQRPDLEPSAEHPPLFPVLLAGLDLVGLDGLRAQGVSLALVSAGGVTLVALLGRRVGGPAVGLVAGAIAAVHPLWFQSAGLVMSESIHLVLVPAVLLGALAVLDEPSWRRVGLLGALVGAAALVRSEALGLGLVVGVPTVVLARTSWRMRAVGLAVLAASCGVVVAPWVIRNQQELGTANLSTNGGKTVYGSTCDATFSGPQLGGFSYDCQFGAAALLLDSPPPGGDHWDAVELDRALGEHARTYLEEHRGEVPKVIAARAVRMWGLAFAEEQLRFDVGEGRHRRVQHAGQWVHLGLLPLAGLGTVALLRGPRRSALVVLGPVLLVTLTVVLVYGGTRMRTGAEPSVAVLAGLGVVELVGWARHRGIPDPEGDDGRIGAA